MAIVKTEICSWNDDEALTRAEHLLLASSCLAVPTETVYGLACDASNAKAVAEVYAVKGRPSFNPLIAHVDSLQRARELVKLSPLAQKLAENFWPGPLTLVAPIKPGAPICDLVTAGLNTLAIRWPQSRTMKALIERINRPIAAPSANLSGCVSPTTAQHVHDSLEGCIDLILDAGACKIGVESTIIADHDDHLVMLRPGGITRQQIETLCKVPLLNAPHHLEQPNSPGQLESHYAPNALIQLNVATPSSKDGFLSFGPQGDFSCQAHFSLSATGDLTEAASRLFTGLRMLDESVQRIAVSSIPDTGLGEAINDRLRRAAAKKHTNT